MAEFSFTSIRSVASFTRAANVAVGQMPVPSRAADSDGAGVGETARRDVAERHPAIDTLAGILIHGGTFDGQVLRSEDFASVAILPEEVAVAEQAQTLGHGGLHEEHSQVRVIAGVALAVAGNAVEPAADQMSVEGEFTKVEVARGGGPIESGLSRAALDARW